MLESIELLPNTGTFVQEVVKFSAIEREIYDLLYICDIWRKKRYFQFLYIYNGGPIFSLSILSLFKLFWSFNRIKIIMYYNLFFHQYMTWVFIKNMLLAYNLTYSCCHCFFTYNFIYVSMYSLHVIKNYNWFYQFIWRQGNDVLIYVKCTFIIFTSFITIILKMHNSMILFLYDLYSFNYYNCWNFKYI